MSTNLEGSISLDYLSFTVPYSDTMMERIKDAFYVGETETNGYGGMGYIESIYVLDGGRMYWHPERPEMGIHVRLNSASVAISGFTALGLISRVLDMGAKIARLDIAFDDYVGLLDIDQMYEKLRSQEVVTRFRKAYRIQGLELGRYEQLGSTINLGARASEAFIRIYDKKKEQEAKKKVVLDIESWIRVEIELKGQKAHMFAGLLARSVFLEGGSTAGELCSELLLGLLDFKEKDGDDLNKSRWETSKWWLEFVRTSEKLTLGIPLKHRTLDDTKRWIKTQVSTSLAMVILSHPDDDNLSGYDFIMDCIKDGAENISKPQQGVLDLYNQQQKEKMI